MKENEQEEKWNLAAKFLTAGLDEEDKPKWEALKDDSKFQEDFAHLQKYWHKFEALPFEQINIAKGWETVWNSAREETKPVRKFSVAPLLKYAAVIAITLLSSYLLWMFINNSPSVGNDSFTTIEAPSGSTSFVTLPDSSKVWLNAGSKISFNKDYGVDNRNITLDGEAFFDVVKRKVSFNVHTEEQDITVLGTAFNVKAYKDDEKVITTLVRGSLKVLPDAPVSEEYLLKPGERLVLWKSRLKGNAQLAELQKQVDTEAETGWKDGWLAVRGESLDELARKIERLHDVKIVFANQELKKYRFTGRIKQLSLEQVLRAMALTSPIEFQIDEKIVTLRENTSTKSKYRSVENSK
jgi:transmembrane sensor